MKKIILIAVALCLVVVVAVHFKTESETIVMKEYTVRDGDTLCDISKSITPNSEDYRKTQRYIIEKNNLENAIIYPEQVITIPYKAEETTPKSLGTFKLTAYCACYDCCKKKPTDKGYGITASGVRAVEGVTVAADKRFPFGTKLIIDGHEYTVQDRGGAIKSNRIDIYFTSHQSALNFGVQYKEVFEG